MTLMVGFGILESLGLLVQYPVLNRAADFMLFHIAWASH